MDKKSKKIIIILSMIIVGGGVGVWYFFLRKVKGTSISMAELKRQLLEQFAITQNEQHNDRINMTVGELVEAPEWEWLETWLIDEMKKKNKDWDSDSLYSSQSASIKVKDLPTMVEALEGIKNFTISSFDWGKYIKHAQQFPMMYRNHLANIEGVTSLPELKEHLQQKFNLP